MPTRAVKKTSAKRSVAKKAPAKKKPKSQGVKPRGSQSGPSPIPAGHHSVTPHLVCRNAGAALDFYKKAFGAIEVVRMLGPGGGLMHGEIKIGDSFIFLADEFPGTSLGSPQKFSGTTVGLHLYVKDADAVFNQAVAAGCKVEMPLMNMFWGDRFGKLLDPFGHSWAIATHIEDVPPAEMKTRMEEAMKQMSMGKPPTA